MPKKKSKKTKRNTTRKKVHHKKHVKTLKKLPVLKDISKVVSKDHEIAYDFATKAYTEFKDVIKSIVLFGSVSKQEQGKNSDIDIIIIVDDCSIKWDQELIAWYRQELSELVSKQRYTRKIHINTVTLTAFWDEIKSGDPVAINVIRYGQPLIDFGGFFEPLKAMLAKGRIRPTPESVYVSLRRGPLHIAKAKYAIVSSVENIYWSMVDASQAALMASGNIPPSPEHIPELLYEVFSKERLLDKKYIDWYMEIYNLAHDSVKGNIKSILGKEIDKYIERAEKFEKEMRGITIKLIENEKIIRLEEKKDLF